MTAKRALRHGGLILLGLILILGAPFSASSTFKAWLSGEGVDAISSASIIIDRPSGEYVVLINRDWHDSEETLQKWVTFFQGGDAGIIFEDLSCSVSESDLGAVEMAQSYQSRLPENQMTVQKENGTMLLSRADCGQFDVIIFSKEYAEACNAQSAYKDNVEVIEVAEITDETETAEGTA